MLIKEKNNTLDDLISKIFFDTSKSNSFIFDGSKDNQKLFKVPGFNKEDLNLNYDITSGILSLNGKIDNPFKSEINCKIYIGENIKAESIKTELKNGILYVDYDIENNLHNKLTNIKIN